MKNLKWFVLVLALLLPSVSASSGQGYLIVVRGGGDLYFQYTPFSNFSPNPQVWIDFKKGTQGVGQNWENAGSLQPGYAAWPDRAIAPNEPGRIIVKDVKNFSMMWTKGQVMGISSELTYLSVLTNPNKYQAFTVVNDGQGNFVVTSIGPSK